MDASRASAVLPAATDSGRDLGQRAADRVAATIGSWKFIIIQSTLLLVWVLLNLSAWVNHWDPYPFILMNLVLSLQAAYAGPIIMMSQNRMAEHDRLVASDDYATDFQAESEVRLIMAHLERQDAMLSEIRDRIRDLEAPHSPPVPRSLDSSVEDLER
jgi:uncharacterized membrane protein